ncbi:DUF397 domain-containing protein [Streptomyces sp. NPDC050264]|uniref:DUF397 domain-containing protein n=1 Tax=Streptomyces sp. NPDC050264 TaxID=3155038 RepID=UPI003423E4B8
MGKTWELTDAAWRRSSYSSDTGGQCVECAPLNGAAWQKSSYSGNEGGDCLEVAATPAGHLIALRDSKNPRGGAFTTTPAAFNAFKAAAALGTL